MDVTNESAVTTELEPGWDVVARERGYRPTEGRWLTPSGQDVPEEFVRRVCGAIIEHP